MAYRKKGQRSKLLDLAKKSRERAQARRAAKAAKAKAAKSKASDRARTEINTPRGTRLRPIRAVKPPLRRMKGGTNLSARAGQVDPTKRTPKQPTRTPAQRAAEKKKLLAKRKKLQGKGGGIGMYAFPGSPKKKTWDKVGSGLRLGGEVLLTGAALAGSGGTAAPALGATRGGRVVLGGLSKAKTALSKLLKGKSKGGGRTTKTSTTTPPKSSGSGSASGGKKPSGPGSRTSRRRTQTPTNTNKRRQARRNKRETAAERRERLDSGGVRMGINRRDAGLAKGRKTQAEKRAARQKRQRYGL